MQYVHYIGVKHKMRFSMCNNLLGHSMDLAAYYHLLVGYLVSQVVATIEAVQFWAMCPTL